MKTNNLEQLGRDVLAFLNGRCPPLKLLYIFGSYVDGTNNAESDIDLAIHVGQSDLTGLEIFDLQNLLADFLKVDHVDLINLGEASDIIKLEVVTKGKCLFAEDGDFKDEFEMYAISDYIRLNDQRKELLEDYFKRTRGDGH